MILLLRYVHAQYIALFNLLHMIVQLLSVFGRVHLSCRSMPDVQKLSTAMVVPHILGVLFLTALTTVVVLLLPASIVKGTHIIFEFLSVALHYTC